MRGLSTRSKGGNHAVIQPALDHLVYVGISFADSDVYLASVCVHGHVAMTWTMMFGPALHQIACDGIDECLILSVDPAAASDVAAQGRYLANAVSPGQFPHFDIRKLLSAHEVKRECDDDAVGARAPHGDAPAILRGIALARSELKAAIALGHQHDLFGIGSRRPERDLAPDHAYHALGIARVPFALVFTLPAEQRNVCPSVQKAEPVTTVGDQKQSSGRRSRPARSNIGGCNRLVGRPGQRPRAPGLLSGRSWRRCRDR